MQVKCANLKQSMKCTQTVWRKHCRPNSARA